MKKLFTSILIIIGLTTSYVGTAQPRSMPFHKQKADSHYALKQQKGLNQSVQAIREIGKLSPRDLILKDLIKGQDQIRRFDTLITFTPNNEFNERHIRTYSAQDYLTSEIIQLWNGNSWFDAFKFTCSYDEAGNHTGSQIVVWNEYDNQWDVDMEVTRTYDEQGNQLSYEDKSFHQGEVYQETKVTFTYDSMGRTTQMHMEDWYEGELEFDFHINYTYDANGDIATAEMEQHDPVNEISYISLFTYSYDHNGIITSMLIQAKEMDVYYNAQHHLFDYDEQGNNTHIAIQFWDEMEEEWESSIRMVTSFNEQSQPLIILIQGWEEDWINYEQTVFTYDEDGEVASKISQYHSGTEWNNSYKNEYGYDEQGNLLKDLSQRWEPSDWENEYQHNFEYDGNKNKISGMFERWEESYWMNDWDYIPVFQTLDFDDLEFTFEVMGPLPHILPYFINMDLMTLFHLYEVDAFRFEATYSQSDNTNVLTHNINQMTLYPNPTNGIINLNMDNQGTGIIEIFNLQGQQLQQLQIGGANRLQINLEDYPSGIYFIRISVDGIVETHKVIKN